MSLISSENRFPLHDGPEFILARDELSLGFLDRSVDGGVHNRDPSLSLQLCGGRETTKLDGLSAPGLRRGVDDSPVERNAIKINAGHRSNAKLHADFVLGEYTNMVLCNAKADRWSIGFVNRVHRRKQTQRANQARISRLRAVPAIIASEMEAVRRVQIWSTRLPGTESFPSDKHPWIPPSSINRPALIAYA